MKMFNRYPTRNLYKTLLSFKRRNFKIIFRSIFYSFNIFCSPYQMLERMLPSFWANPSKNAISFTISSRFSAGLRPEKFLRTQCIHFFFVFRQSFLLSLKKNKNNFRTHKMLLSCFFMRFLWVGWYYIKRWRKENELYT